jgi:hypothetical protein
LSIADEEAALALGRRLQQLKAEIIGRLHGIVCARDEGAILVLIALGSATVDFGYELIGEQKMQSLLDELKRYLHRLAEEERREHRMQ